MTSVADVFAAGEVPDIRHRQAITGDGCRSAIDAEKRWLENQGEAENAIDPGFWG
jgi:thioredoxin reductase